MGVVVFCADEASLRHPHLIGLDDINLEGLPWMVTISNAQAARDFAKESDDVDEVWVVSSDEVSAINLAAAIKQDNMNQCVYLVAFGATGSLLSCTKAAGIDGVFSRRELVTRYALEKKRREGTDIEEATGGCEISQSAAEREDSVAFTPDKACEDFAETAESEMPAEVEASFVSEAQSVTDRDMPTGKPASVEEDFCADAPEVSVEAALPKSSNVQKASDESKIRDTSFDETVPDGNETQSRSLGNAFVLTVVSGSGGVGKSSVAALSAFCAQSRGYRTVLLDCDLQFGDLHYFMGIHDPVRIEDILADPSTAKSLGEQKDTPALVASLSHMEQADSFADKLPRLIAILSSCFDVIVVNTGSSWAEYHAQLLECSSRVLFLVDQRASSIRACRRALDLCRRCGIASSSFAYAINHCTRRALLSSVDASCALQGVHVLELKEGGSLVEELLSAGLAAQLWHSRNELCASLDKALNEILPPSRTLNSGSRGIARIQHNVFGISRRQRRLRHADSDGSSQVAGNDTSDNQTYARQGADTASLMCS